MKAIRTSPSLFAFCLTLGLALSLASPALGQTDPFPEYAEIRGNVDFWIRVFGEWSRGQAAVHDLEHPEVVYEVVDLPPPIEERYTDAQKDFLEATREAWEDRLRTLAGKVDRREALTDDEKRWALALTGAGGNDAVRDAAERVRTQRGLRERFRRGLEISRRYDPTLRRIFADAGLPEDLAYLPHVESSFQASARSSAGALGIWQFTRGTGRQYLRVDRHVDERLDPILAARGAAGYLRDAQDKLGDWAIALTSYNHGVNGMRRAVAAHGSDYPTIFREYRGRLFGFASKNFYAEFLAARRIASAPERFFPDGISAEAAFDHESVRLAQFATPSDLSRAYRVDREELVRINPSWTDRAVRNDASLPTGAHVWLPAGTLARAAANGDRPEAVLKAAAASARTHRVRRGETLSEIARRYTLTVATLRELNGIPSRSSLIRVGQELRVSGGERLATHRVRRGETLSAIAARYGMTTTRLREINGLARHSDLIRIGQQLQVAAAFRVHVVRRGETLLRIALAYGVRLADLITHNNIREPSSIYPGQKIRIPSIR